MGDGMIHQREDYGYIEEFVTVPGDDLNNVDTLPHVD
jgi:hypothetical protein